MASNKSRSPAKKSPESNNSMSYSPKNRSECIDSSLIGYRESQPSAGGLDVNSAGHNPEKGTGSCQDH